MNDSVIVVGSTGLIGKLLVSELCKQNLDITAVTRSPNKDFDSKVKILEIDFDLFLKKENLPKCDHVYLCLGTTIKKAGNQKEFKKVDYEYSLFFAEKAREAGAKKISLVSSVGANYDSKNFYLRVKGEIEEAIKKIDFEQINIYRPSLLVGARSETRFFELLGQKLSFLINLFLHGPLKKYRSINANKLSQFIANSKNNIGVNYYFFEDFK